MIPPTPSPTLAPDVQRQANEYHQAAAVERRRANHHQADLNLVAAAELEARPPEDQPELPGGTREARRPTPNRVPSDRPAASTGLRPEPCTVSEADSVTGTTVPAHTVGYQDLGGYVYEIVVGGQATRGTVSPVGETDWVAISRHGTVLGYHPNQATAALAIGKEWEARSRYVRLGRHAPGGDEKGPLADSVGRANAQPRVVQAFAIP